MPAVEDSAIDIVSLRALSFAAIRSAWGSKSCNISPPPFLSRNCRRERSPATTYETILYAEDGPIGALTLNCPEDGNLFIPTMCHEPCD